MGHMTALSLDKEFDPAEKVNVLCSNVNAQFLIVCYQYGGIWSYASDQ